MLTNLKGSYWRREQWEKVVGLIDRLLVLDPAAGASWRDRGSREQPGRGRARARGLGALPDGLPDAPDHEQVKGHLAACGTSSRASTEWGTLDMAPTPAR